MVATVAKRAGKGQAGPGRCVLLTGVREGIGKSLMLAMAEAGGPFPTGRTALLSLDICRVLNLWQIN
ncbi:hypothetical protein [Roseibium algae]|uniref:Uncharacterized protein n=1 Tax=Roseibium algae TaxID=3123038 RepID=A0ABU8TJJ5_9HYPH